MKWICGKSTISALTRVIEVRPFIQLLNTWVLEANIQGFFDNIAHESILAQIGQFLEIDRFEQGWLKAGFMLNGKVNPTETGTPQGGVCLPLLANIGLHGLETFLKSTNPKLGVVRYADDFIVTARDKGSLENAQIHIQLQFRPVVQNF